VANGCLDRANLEAALNLACNGPTGDAAQTTVGEIYERGLGVPPDYGMAAEWYGKASDQGYARATYNLGTLYEQGLGVEKDALKALNLYRQAGGLKGEIGFEDAYQQELDKQRAELQKSVEERSAEVDALQKQVEELQEKLNTQPNAASTAGADAGRRVAWSLRSCARAGASSRSSPLPVSHTRAGADHRRPASIERPASISGLQARSLLRAVIGSRTIGA
jgi:hypothetical protein